MRARRQDRWGRAPQLYLRVSGDLAWRNRDVERLDREIQEIKTKLYASKNSRAWRLYLSMCPMVVGARRVSSRFWIGTRNKAERSDGSD
jgi:hypothetical protein